MFDYDPLDPRVLEDPFPFYRRLRDEAPAYYSKKYNTWFLSRFEDIWAAERDFKHFTIVNGQMPSQILGFEEFDSDQAEVEFGDSPASLDPPRHTHLRAALTSAFRPSAAQALEARTRELVRGFIDEFIDRGEADVVLDLAMRTSVRIASTLIGLPLDMADWFVERVNAMFIRDETGWQRTDDGMAGVLELHAFLAEFIAERRRRGGSSDDAIDRLLNAKIQGESLSDKDCLSTISLLLVGGTETLPKAFSGAVYRLGKHPDQRSACVENPSLVPSAFQEALRMDMPTQMLGRFVAKTWEIHGQSLEPGQGVLFLWASANRDDREFPDPDRFDIQRQAPRILTFGAGPHMCLGAHVARMEGEVMLQELLARVPEYELLMDDAVQMRSEVFRGYVSLPIRFPTT
ncbi:cytochrome P450 [Myxococcota bacterium]|nr:cytochrome P450 [Myxococcota bacterium]